MDQAFLDMMAKMTPMIESEPNRITPKVKFALGPLKIKNNATLIATINNDNNPNLFIKYSPCLLLRQNPEPS